MIGYKYFSTKGMMWRNHQRAIVPMSMPHVNPNLTLGMAKKLLTQQGALMLRWDKEFDLNKTGEWWHIIKDVPEDIMSLPKKTRYMIRKGSKMYEARLCDKNYIVTHGYPVYLSAFKRYDTFEECFKEKEFQLGVSGLPECTEFWGVFDNNNVLVAFSENLVRDGACFYSSMWLDPIAMKKFAGYVLFHEMNKYYLNKKNVKYVSDGARSISHQTNIHEFLQSKFLFRKAYSKLEIVYTPWLFIIVTFFYPFRSFFSNSKLHFLQKISVLLKQESIRQSCVRKFH